MCNSRCPRTVGFFIGCLLLAMNDNPTLAQRPAKNSVEAATLGNYVVLGWNDLGMHCMNQNYGSLCVLPPYNVLNAQVIRRGNPPQLIQAGVELSYRFPANTTSVNKVDFWQYSKPLFGVILSPNVGLTGKGLTGSMDWSAGLGLYEAAGVPLTPYEDATPTVQQPYQYAEVSLRSAVDHALLDKTTFVAPVSVEIHCDKCHQEDGMSTEEAILLEHDAVDGRSLLLSRPVLCASCHSSNALGTKGRPGLASLSQAIHGKHAEESSAGCYDCHPGQQTKCLRDAMFSAGKKCEDCHGTLSQVARSIRNGRRPWLDEPSCAQSGCHDADHAPEAGKLYRHSKGHGGVACEACHNSPHAILPTVQPRDGVQMARVQGKSTYLKDCGVCHTAKPLEAGPHGVLTSWRIANHVTNKALLSGSELTRADYNRDGKVNVADVIFQVNRGL